MLFFRPEGPLRPRLQWVDNQNPDMMDIYPCLAIFTGHRERDSGAGVFMVDAQHTITTLADMSLGVCIEFLNTVRRKVRPTILGCLF